MNRRNSILLALAVLALAAAVAVGVVVSRDDDEGASDDTTTTADVSTATPAPTFDAPGAAAPGEQDQTDDDVLGDWTAQDVEDAIANPRTPPPETAPRADPPGASTEPGAPGGQTAPSVEPTEPGPRSAAAPIKRCTQPSKVAALPEYPYSRDCHKRSFAAFPAKAMGILFFKTPGGASQCTASVAVTRIGQTKGNESVIVTAGHCLGLTPSESASGSWEPFTNAFWLSAPSFEEYKRTKFPTQESFDIWLAKNVWLPYTWANSTVPVGYVPSPWKNGSGWRYDFGAIVVQPRGTSTILKKVGALGVNMNGVGVNKMIHSYGYPADKPFDGSKLFICAGKAKVGDKVTRAGTLTVLGIGCDMTGGSSGGPWLRAGDPDFFVVSVNSYGPAGPPRSVENVMFGPNLNGDHWATFVAARDHR